LDGAWKDFRVRPGLPSITVRRGARIAPGMRLASGRGRRESVHLWAALDRSEIDAATIE
jgi:hypothetical protein